MEDRARSLPPLRDGMGDHEMRPRIIMASELLNGDIEVSESQAHDVMKQLGQLNQVALLYKFDELLPSERFRMEAIWAPGLHQHSSHALMLC